jgi:tRNA (mo5U34)-methyltransferase
LKAGPRYALLREWARGQLEFSWLLPLIVASEDLLASDAHGDLPGWRQALAELPAAGVACDGALAAPRLGHPAADLVGLGETLMRLHPWRKGPLQLAGLYIDAEWRSDWKWDRIAAQLDLAGHRVLDVGCGNGYYGWRMLAAGAECVIGFDPTLVYVMQWLACHHFAGAARNFVLPLGCEHLPTRPGCFDSVFSMGVLYHRRDPVAHLRHLAGLVRPGGQVVLETLIVEDREPVELVPRGRYARMRNVWAIPSLPRLREWLAAAGLGHAVLLDITATSIEEQRSTAWMRFESLAECLDPADPRRTVEGLPAPLRAALVARAPDEPGQHAL